MTNLRETAAAIVVFLFAATALNAAPATLYGMQLGSKPSVQRCAGRDAGSGAPCWTVDTIGDGPNLHPLRLHFGKNTPEISKYPFAIAKIGDDGVVDLIYVFTTGIKSQDLAHSQLLAKFGAATDEMLREGQTQGGLHFKAWSSRWDIEDGQQVMFEGVSGGLDDGMIAATTERGRQSLAAVNRAKRGAEPQL